jgi:hypothetical protein
MFIFGKRPRPKSVYIHGQSAPQRGSMSTAQEIAEWMAAEVEREGLLIQKVAAFEIEKRFGAEFVYVNENGNRAINPEVLGAFEKLLPQEKAVWVRKARFWRKREPTDKAGRQQ